MEWRESQLQPGKLEVEFSTAQAEALHAACEERTTYRAKVGNSPLEFDQEIIKLTDNPLPENGVCINFEESGLEEVRALSHEFAFRTSEVATEIDPNLDILQQKVRGIQRCDLGYAALTLSLETEGAVMAHATNFHSKLEAFLRASSEGNID